MIRFIFGVSIYLTLSLLFFLSEGFGDPLFTTQTWISSFLLPIWSVGAISFWHDIGREFLPTPKNDFLKSSLFILWISAIVSYVVWVHIQLWAVPLLIVIPPLILMFEDIIHHKWDSLPQLNKNQWMSLGIWVISSYLVYWILTISWILIRVWYMDSFKDGVVFYMR